ncbi:MAG: hypothetical protein GVY13_02055 [Alphaproteobacteria bacterium]|nr:hypothetical protein [Alphaproteobacteria bacterium]
MDSVGTTRESGSVSAATTSSDASSPRTGPAGAPAADGPALARAHDLVALDDVIRIRSRIKAQLFPTGGFPVNDLKALENDPAFSKIADYKFSAFSMEPGSLAFIKSLIAEVKPKLVLEFGSGLSSAVLARAQRDARPATKDLYYLSVEQTEDYARDSLDLVKRAGIDHVRFIVAGMKPVKACGIETQCYDLEYSYLERILDGEKIDFVIVDGPVTGGPHGVPDSRFPTILLLKDFLAPGAIICLDDALRDTELRLASLWRQLPFVEILGMKIVGKGVTVARTKAV